MAPALRRSFDAVLFDWSGTLVEYPLREDRFRPVLQRLGRPHDDASVADLVTAVRELERSYGDLATYSTYPEVVDVITALTADGVKVAIVSDFHVDLRPHLESLGLLDRISGFALSCEIGFAKPDPMMFQAALDMVAVPPERCLMVGDNPRPDTGATALGIATLILPLQRAPRPPLLERVLSLVGAGSATA